MLEVIETALFTRLLPAYLLDDEYAALQETLFRHPEIGDIVPGSDGVRKMRGDLKAEVNVEDYELSIT